MIHMLENAIPSSLGYFMPAEWEPHSYTWLAWPHNLETWNKNDIHEVEKVYIEIIRHLIDSELINILINNKYEKQRISSLINDNKLNNSSINFYIIPTEDAWIRDFGPNFLVKDTANGRHVAINRWHFNSWGGKYPWKKDNDAKLKIILETKVPWFNTDIVLEGGAIDVNGKGTCITTSSCLINPNRNKNLSLNQMEKILNDYLGVNNTIWLNGFIQGDDTDGHVDNLARFVNSETIVYVVEKDINDVNFKNLNLLSYSLEKSLNHEEKTFTTLPLPLPSAIRHKNIQLPASYANFYIGNHTVLVPAFNDPNDAIAKDILKSCFPNRKVVLVDSRALIKGLGGLHCITQQQPTNTLNLKI